MNDHGQPWCLFLSFVYGSNIGTVETTSIMPNPGLSSTFLELLHFQLFLTEIMHVLKVCTEYWQTRAWIPEKVQSYYINVPSKLPD